MLRLVHDPGYDEDKNRELHDFKDHLLVVRGRNEVMTINRIVTESNASSCSEIDAPQARRIRNNDAMSRATIRAIDFFAVLRERRSSRRLLSAPDRSSRRP